MTSSDKTSSDNNAWPALAYADWQDTCDTLHLWTQVVGKVKLALSAACPTTGGASCCTSPRAG